MKEGDKIVWFIHVNAGPESLREGTITRIRGDVCWVDNNHSPEEWIFTAYCWPVSVREELTAILVERKRLEKAWDDSMGLIYELRNAVTRGPQGSTL